MSKRRSDTQLTKDDYEKQGFNHQHEPEDPRDVVDPTKMADSKIMSGRKIAPLKKGRGRGGPAGGSLPNFFASTPTGGFGINGASQSEGGFAGFGTPQSAAPATPTFGGNATGGFNFGGNSPAPEPPKVNPFASLAPPTTNGGFGTPQLGGLFGSPTPQSSSTGGIFGNNNGNASPAPVSAGFTFGGNNTAAPAQPATTSFNKAPTFNFGGNSAAAPMFGGGDNKPAAPSGSFTFGANNGTSAAVTPPATSSFTFGSSTATTGGQPTSGYFGNFKSEGTPEPQAAPAAAPAPTFTFGAATPNTGTPSTSLFGKPADSQGKSLFAKPVEQQGSSLFGRPSPSPEPTSGNLFKPSPSPEPSNNLFGSPAPTPTTNSFFGQPKEQEQSKPSFTGFGDNTPVTPKHEPPKALFGFGGADSNAQQEPPKSPFVGFGDNKTEAPKSPFFGGFGTPNEKKDEPSKPPLFGFGQSSTENKPETPKAPTTFFGAPSTPGMEINDDIMADNSPPKSPSVFNPPVNSPSPFTGFGSPKLAAASPKESTPPPAMFAPTAMPSTATTSSAVNNTTATAAAASASANFRIPSPPLPSDSTSWTTAQLNEYYNLSALRSLNHSFLEALKKADQLGDWSMSCEIYINESKKIKECQQNGERYKGVTVEPKLGSNISSKRSSTHDDEVQGGGGKRSKGNGEDSKFSGSDSSKALASILGGKNNSTTSSSDAYKLASKPTHGFVPPSASAPATPTGMKLASAPLFSFRPPATATEEKDEEGKNEDESKNASAVMSPASSVFDSPNSSKNNSSFVNPFSTKLPDPSEKDVGDDDEDDDNTPAAPSPSGSLFGRVSEPKKEPTGSIFPSSKPASGSGLFSGKFGETNGTNGTTSLFGSKPDAPKGLFGSTTSSTAPSPNASGSSLFGAPGVKETGFSFGSSNGASTPSVPASSTVTPSDDHNSEPDDNAHLAKNDVDLSRQGPGEEDEDSKFEIRAMIYEVNPEKPPKKIGVGLLRVLKNRITAKARVLTRTEAGKVVLNVGLVQGITYTPGKGGKFLPIVEFLPGGGRKCYTVRVKEEADAKNLGEAMDEAKMSS